MTFKLGQFVRLSKTDFCRYAKLGLELTSDETRRVYAYIPEYASYHDSRRTDGVPGMVALKLTGTYADHMYGYFSHLTDVGAKVTKLPKCKAYNKGLS